MLVHDTFYSFHNNGSKFAGLLLFFSLPIISINVLCPSHMTVCETETWQTFLSVCLCTEIHFMIISIMRLQKLLLVNNEMAGLTFVFMVVTTDSDEHT